VGVFSHNLFPHPPLASQSGLQIKHIIGITKIGDFMTTQEAHYDGCVEIMNNHMNKLYLLELDEDELRWMKSNSTFYRNIAESLLDLANDVDNMLDD